MLKKEMQVAIDRLEKDLLSRESRIQEIELIHKKELKEKYKQLGILDKQLKQKNKVISDNGVAITKLKAENTILLKDQGLVLDEVKAALNAFRVVYRSDAVEQNVFDHIEKIARKLK